MRVVPEGLLEVVAPHVGEGNGTMSGPSFGRVPCAFLLPFYLCPATAAWGLWIVGRGQDRPLDAPSPPFPSALKNGPRTFSSPSTVLFGSLGLAFFGPSC